MKIEDKNIRERIVVPTTEEEAKAFLLDIIGIDGMHVSIHGTADDNGSFHEDNFIRGYMIATELDKEYGSYAQAVIYRNGRKEIVLNDANLVGREIHYSGERI